ncbi:OmpA family protein [bacterium]|nr:OmpA family protein [bacterium]
MAIAKQQADFKAFNEHELYLFSQEGQRKIRPVLVVVSTAFALLYFFSLQLNKRHIEQDLTARSMAGLSNENVNVSFEGRDATLTGTVLSEKEGADLVDKVAQVWGVRAVNNQLDIMPSLSQDLQVNQTAKQLLETGHVNLSGLQFSSASVDLSQQAKDKLDHLLEAIKLMPGAVFKVSGHTDATGDSASNFSLSLKRAKSVKAYLVAQGVPQDQLIAQGYGDSQPVADNRTAVGREKNRRIEIVQLKPGMY